LTDNANNTNSMNNNLILIKTEIFPFIKINFFN
jgi:hypothetical protein